MIFDWHHFETHPQTNQLFQDISYLEHVSGERTWEGMLEESGGEKLLKVKDTQGVINTFKIFDVERNGGDITKWKFSRNGDGKGLRVVVFNS